MTMLIRHADAERDAAACAEIYGPYVSDSAVSFETVPPSAEAFAARIARLERTHAFLVAVDGQALSSADAIAGFAYAGPHHERAGYRWAATVSVYVAERCHRRGVGRALYGSLLDLLRRQGLWVACSGITLPNDASVALHESCGFVPVGVYRRIGWKAGSWRDVGWWQLALRTPDGDHGSAPPTEPGPPARLP
jgi:phosphinothricin acetyltransferase